MALTLSNRETFLALQWIEAEPGRRAHFRELATNLQKRYQEAAIPRLSDAILLELEEALPKVEGLAGELLKSGMLKVNFYEFALALILESESKTYSSLTAPPLWREDTGSLYSTQTSRS